MLQLLFMGGVKLLTNIWHKTGEGCKISVTLTNYSICWLSEAKATGIMWFGTYTWWDSVTWFCSPSTPFIKQPFRGQGSFFWSLELALSFSPPLFSHLVILHQSPTPKHTRRKSQINHITKSQASSFDTLATPLGLRHKLEGMQALPQKEFNVTACVRVCVWEGKGASMRGHRKRHKKKKR